MLTSWNRRRRREFARQRRHASASLAIVILLSIAIDPVSALFGLGDKRFKYEGLINSGDLGLGQIDGSIAAFGDWNGDQL